MNKRWKARVECAELWYEDYRTFMDFLGVNFEGKSCWVTVEPERKATSNPQLAYYFGVVVKILSDYTGFGKESMDILLKQKFLSEIREMEGHYYLITKSKKDVSTAQFTEFVNDVKQWAFDEFQLIIPDPDEVQLTDVII